VDEETKKCLEADAKKLETAGFNPYEATMSSSNAGRAVIDLKDMAVNEQNCSSGADGDSNTQQPANIASSQNFPDSEQTAMALLDAGIEGCDLEKLETAKAFVQNNIDPFEASNELVSKLGTADQLWSTLRESISSSDVKPTESRPEKSSVSNPVVDAVSSALSSLSVQATVEKENINSSLKTLTKVLDNVVANPDEVRYRKLRLRNPTIRNKLVEPAEGAAVKILESLGFEKKKEGDEDILVLEEKGRASFETRYQSTRQAVDNLLSQLE